MPIAQPQPARLAARQASESDLTSSPTGTATSGSRSAPSSSVSTTTSRSSGSTSGGRSMSMTSTNLTSSTPGASSTSDLPYFPTPTTTAVDNTAGLGFTKNAVEGALIVAAVGLIITLIMWRVLQLRRHNRPLGHFFRAEPQPDVPARPRAVPRTTGLPAVPPLPASVICDLLPTTNPALPGDRRRVRGRRTHAGDIDAGGRRGDVAHPDDPDEFLPEYDDKDMLPKYQDLESSNAISRYGTNGGGGLGDNIPLVTRLQLSNSATLERGNAPASADSYENADPPSSPLRRSSVGGI